jgi:hypothetical protein
MKQEKAQWQQRQQARTGDPARPSRNSLLRIGFSAYQLIESKIDRKEHFKTNAMEDDLGQPNYGAQFRPTNIYHRSVELPFPSPTGISGPRLMKNLGTIHRASLARWMGDRKGQPSADPVLFLPGKIGRRSCVPEGRIEPSPGWTLSLSYAKGKGNPGLTQRMILRVP